MHDYPMTMPPRTLAPDEVASMHGVLAKCQGVIDMAVGGLARDLTPEDRRELEACVVSACRSAAVAREMLAGHEAIAAMIKAQATAWGDRRNGRA